MKGVSLIPVEGDSPSTAFFPVNQCKEKSLTNEIYVDKDSFALHVLIKNKLLLKCF